MHEGVPVPHHNNNNGVSEQQTMVNNKLVNYNSTISACEKAGGNEGMSEDQFTLFFRKKDSLAHCQFECH